MCPPAPQSEPEFIYASGVGNITNHTTSQANGLATNWGQFIFQSANEIAVNTQFRKKLEGIQSKTPGEKEWWEKRRATIETELLNEVDEEAADKASTGKPASEEDAVLVDPGSPAAAPAEASTPAATSAKAPAPSTPAPGTPGTPSSKKKKGKK